MLLFWALQWQWCQQKEDSSEKRGINRWRSLREWLVKNEQNVQGVIKSCEVMPAPDHGCTLLVLQGCKHQSQRISEATKAHSDMKKKIKNGKLRFKGKMQCPNAWRITDTAVSGGFEQSQRGRAGRRAEQREQQNEKSAVVVSNSQSHQPEPIPALMTGWNLLECSVTPLRVFPVCNTDLAPVTPYLPDSRVQEQSWRQLAFPYLIPLHWEL